MNLVVLKGNLTRDPEVRSVNVGGKNTQVANFTVAVNRHFKRADGSKDQEVTFVDCEAWDTGANILNEYCKKGDALLVNGSLKMDVWEVDGQKRSKMKIRVNNFEKLSRSSSTNQNTVVQAAENDHQVDAESVDAESVDATTEIPF